MAYNIFTSFTWLKFISLFIYSAQYLCGSYQIKLYTFNLDVQGVSKYWSVHDNNAK